MNWARHFADRLANHMSLYISTCAHCTEPGAVRASHVHGEFITRLTRVLKLRYGQ